MDIICAGFIGNSKQISSFSEEEELTSKIEAQLPKILTDISSQDGLIKAFYDARRECTKILARLSLDLSAYQMKQYNWIEKIIYEERVKETRSLSIATPLSSKINLFDLNVLDFKKYQIFLREIQGFIDQNQQITDNYNKGIYSDGSEPLFKIGDGELKRVITEAKEELLKHKNIFRLYFTLNPSNKIASPRWITSPRWTVP